MPRRLLQHRLLRSDIAEALRHTDKGWGKRKKQEYRALIKEAKAALRENPYVSRPRPDIHPEARVYRIAQPGRDAAHAFLYVITPDDNVILVRFLNAARDLPKHFPEDHAGGLSSG
jgi:plasmid stabilization system protein ParE